MIWWAVLLYGAGIILLVAEAMIPGLICGFIGSLLIVASLVVFYFVRPDLIVPASIMAFVFAGVCTAGGILWLPHTRIGRLMTLHQSQDSSDGWVSNLSDASLMGATGEVYTQLRPAGTIFVGDKRVSAVSNGGFIEKGAAVRVILVDGNRVVVEPADEA